MEFVSAGIRIGQVGYCSSRSVRQTTGITQQNREHIYHKKWFYLGEIFATVFNL